MNCKVIEFYLLHGGRVREREINDELMVASLGSKGLRSSIFKREFDSERKNG